ncbi:MAG: hypothetical protein L6R39_004251 [Caloplaca ligustica]|nr:MAG: hypothetical protein L6R39_004251 [Caloplaca ligustica]
MDGSTESVSLLEKAGLNALLPPYASLEQARSLITQLQNSTSELPSIVRKFQRWVDLSEREIDTGHSPNEDMRLLFHIFSDAISEYIELLSKLSQYIYRQILSLQHDRATPRELLAWVHDDLERANVEVVGLAELWLNLQHTSRCMLFGNPTDEEASGDPEQPPPSPASDNSIQIIVGVEQAFSLHSTMAGGVTRRKSHPQDTATATVNSPISTPLLLPVLLLLLIFHFLGML